MNDENELPLNERPAQVLRDAPPTPARRPSRTEFVWQDRREGRDAERTLQVVFWSTLMIMAGLIFLSDNLGLLPQIRGVGAFDWIMLGAGGLLLAGSVIRALLPEVERPSGFWIIVGIVLLALSASKIFGLDIGSNWWPLAIIAVGLMMLVKALRR